MNLEQLKKFLREIEAAPRKSLSQNFLIDQNIIQKIVKLAEVKSGDQVLEIGPGPGSLTYALLKAGAKVLAVEKDHLFATHLQSSPNLQVIEQDFLKTELPDVSGWKVVANLPYHITAPILEKIFPLPFTSITIMVQKEVASRMVAKPKTPEYGSFSLFTACHTTPAGQFSVSATSFYPVPSVSSTVIRLDPKPLPTPNPIPWIRLAFQQRRKKLTTSLRAKVPHIAAALEQTNLSPNARPEELDLDEWIRLVSLF